MFCVNCGGLIKESALFCTECGRRIQDGAFPHKKATLTKRRVIFGLIICAVAIGIYFFSGIFGADQLDSVQKKDIRNQDIASSVVNIYCEGTSEDGEVTSGGSGTIITEDGLVLTNAHIIPQNIDSDAGEKSCLVILPDPETGSPKEMYYAQPLVVPDISEKYDLAFVLIDDVYYDEDSGTVHGEYPKKFPAYDGEQYCKSENIKLGEPVRIYGYPAISGGYALTVTDGIVSSLLLDEGLVVTSAKISHGNSGGLAVDENGCRIGIPSMVSSDEAESLGVIISGSLISNFVDEVRMEYSE